MQDALLIKMPGEEQKRVVHLMTACCSRYFFYESDFLVGSKVRVRARTRLSPAHIRSLLPKWEKEGLFIVLCIWNVSALYTIVGILALIVQSGTVRNCLISTRSVCGLVYLLYP